MKILLAEDIESIRRVVMFQLASGGHEVISVANGLEAVKVLDRESVDILVTDIDMPEKNGLELISEVRARQAIEGLPILVYSARMKDIVSKTALALGANAFLEKPSPTPMLLRAVADLCVPTRETCSLDGSARLSEGLGMTLARQRGLL